MVASPEMTATAADAMKDAHVGVGLFLVAACYVLIIVFFDFL